MKPRPIESILTAALAVLMMIACRPSSVNGTENANSPAPIPSPTPVVLSIAAVGDVMIGSTSIDETFLPPNDGRDILKEVTPILSRADIAFGNLEGPLVDGGKNEKCAPTAKNCFAFRTPTRYANLLRQAGFDVFSLANNHASDYGAFGRQSTIATLDAAGIKHAGADRSRYSTTVLEVKGKKVAFVGFGHNAIVPNVNEIEAAQRYVQEAGRIADIVVVSVHAGGEGEGAERVPYATEVYFKELRGNLRVFSKAVIDAGADLVLGHGPHVLRGLEVYKDRLVVYSMGNFATYGMFNLKGPKGVTAIFELNLAEDGRFIDGRIHAGRQPGRGGPVLDPSGEAIRKLQELSKLDFGKDAPRISDDGKIVP